MSDGIGMVCYWGGLLEMYTSKDDDFKTIEELNLYFLSQYIVAKLVKIPINDTYVKYKTNCPNLSIKVKAVDNVIDYMKNKIFTFNHLDLIVTNCEVSRN
jgi:hypothetical protein